jgi:hypothetical protein
MAMLCFLATASACRFCAGGEAHTSAEHELTNQRRIIITHCGVLANGQPPLHVRLPGARRIPPNRSLEELCNRADGPIARKQAHDLIGV